MKPSDPDAGLAKTAARITALESEKKELELEHATLMRSALSEGMGMIPLDAYPDVEHPMTDAELKSYGPLGEAVIGLTAKDQCEVLEDAKRKFGMDRVTGTPEQKLAALEYVRGLARLRREAYTADKPPAQLELERTCVIVFADLMQRVSCPISLVLFNENFSAYKTSLPVAKFARTIRIILASWAVGKQRVTVATPEEQKLPDADEFRALLDETKRLLPETVGYAVILGEGSESSYGSFGVERAVAAKLLGELEEVLEAQAITDVKDDLSSALAPYTDDEKRDALREAHRMAGAAIHERTRKIIRDWHCPPGAPRTASHLELLGMNVAHVQALLIGDGWKLTRKKHVDQLIEASQDPRFAEIMMKAMNFLSAPMASDGRELEEPVPIGSFLATWREAAYARLEVGHKLAAALCLTDVPDDIEVRAPWEAWSLVIPDGLLPDHEGVPVARAWCMGIDPVFIIGGNGRITSRDPTRPSDSPGYVALLNLIKGACLALSNPDDFRKERSYKPAAHSTSKRKGPPDLEQAKFMLSAPVKVDLREHLAGVLTGRKGASPTVQFLVRGHWRNQAHGPQRSLRRTQWIEPFWKGPEEARVLLRQHKVEP